MASKSTASPTWPPVLAALLLLGGTMLLFLMLRTAPNQNRWTAFCESIGTSLEGRPLDCYRFGSGAKVVFLSASIHGSEGAGTPLAHQLMDWLEGNPSAIAGVTVWVMPVTNPDGLAAGRRFNARGVDLNRNFPASNREEEQRFGPTPLSEPESAALFEFIGRIQPAAILAIHQPLNCVDYDGPDSARVLAKRFSRLSGLKLEKLGARPGSLGAWFGETLGRPIVTVELPRQMIEDPGRLWKKYGPGLIDFISAVREFPAVRPFPK